MSDATTEGIHIHVDAVYVEERSNPRDNYFFFAYHVTISNVGERPAQLVSRVWIITDADGEEERVEGPGVVGETPLLAPGQSFAYTSFCPLRTSFGTMHGTYRMVRPDGTSFDAVIAPFSLAMPNAVN
ncbi:MAG: Co2+/Mg2+ efflux protein ApaG [Thermoanaerobaculia bacterium]|nr:Co2+/Mg2+ efflux protein ApaG [Thermoanaerobaculia bacterium]